MPSLRRSTLHLSGPQHSLQRWLRNRLIDDSTTFPVHICPLSLHRKGKADWIPGKLRVAELFFDVPVDYSKPNDGTLRLFARSVSRLNKPVEPTKEDIKLPWLVYLQGGPGFGCSSPQNYGWIEPALSKGYQVRGHQRPRLLNFHSRMRHLGLI